MDNRDWMAFAEETAREAGKILRKHHGTRQSIRYKGEINLVTEVDWRSEAYIMEKIRSAFPDHGILSEESREVKAPSPYRWLVDPLDGTTNYAHNYPFFCVSIALERNGDILAGAVFDPLRRESFTAGAGTGAFLNGRRIAVSSVEELRKSLLSTGFSYDVKTSRDNNLNYFRAFVFAGQAIRRDGAAALDLCYLACGRFDGFWELKLKPWDTAAGLLIVKEAGGLATRLDGSPYGIHDPNIVASNDLIHKQVLAGLRRGEKRSARAV
jgi:myo-inositol-1(or 4)-monophosphatase